LVEIMNKEGWLSTDSTGNATHIDAQMNFVFGGYQGRQAYGMLIEGNYWYNESVDNYVMQDYYDYTQKTSRNVKWMPLPTSFNSPVTKESEGRTLTLLDACSNSVAFVNNNIKDNATLVEECKKFLRFLYTDAELSHFVGATGVLKKALDFEILKEDMNRLSSFQKSVVDVYNAGKILTLIGGNKSFELNAEDLALTGSNPILDAHLGGQMWNNYLDCLRSNYTSAQIFEDVRFTQKDWLDYYYEG